MRVDLKSLPRRSLRIWHQTGRARPHHLPVGRAEQGMRLRALHWRCQQDWEYFQRHNPIILNGLTFPSDQRLRAELRRQQWDVMSAWFMIMH